MDESDQNLPAHSVTVFHVTVLDIDTTEIENEGEGDSLGVLVPRVVRHVAAIDDDHAKKPFFIILLFSDF